MGWIEGKSVWLFLPAFTDEFVGGNALEGLEPFSEVVGSDEVAEVSSSLVVAIVVVALYGRFLDGPVHAFDLSVDPGMVRLSKPVVDAMPKAGPTKRMAAKTGGCPLTVLQQVGELDSVIGEHSMDAIWDRFDKGLEEGDGGLHVGLLYQLNHGELRGAINGNEEVKLAFRSTHFGQIDMEETDRITVELLPLGLAAFHFRQPADAMPFQAAMQRIACQAGDRSLECIEAVIQRQQRVLAKGNDDRLLLHRQNRRPGRFRPRGKDRPPNNAFAI